MMLTPTISHQPLTPPGSPSSPSIPISTAGSSTSRPLTSSPMPATCEPGGVVQAELAQQANEVCQLVAKANRAPHGLHADELRRLLSDIHSLHILAQQLSSSSSSSAQSCASTSTTSTAGSATAMSSGIAKKKPSHHAAVLSRPLSSTPNPTCTNSTSTTATLPTSASPFATTSSLASWCLSSSAQARACKPIRPRAQPTSTPPTSLTTASSASTTTPSATPETLSGPRACANCGTSNTVQWRCGADGKPSLCNACGLRYRYNLKKKALYEDIACVRAMSQRSPPFRSLASSPPSRSRSPATSPAVGVAPPSAAAPKASAASICPPKPSTQPGSDLNAKAAPPAVANEIEGRRSNIYSLLN